MLPEGRFQDITLRCVTDLAHMRRIWERTSSKPGQPVPVRQVIDLALACIHFGQFDEALDWLTRRPKYITAPEYNALEAVRNYIEGRRRMAFEKEGWKPDNLLAVQSFRTAKEIIKRFSLSQLNAQLRLPQRISDIYLGMQHEAIYQAQQTGDEKKRRDMLTFADKCSRLAVENSETGFEAVQSRVHLKLQPVINDYQASMAVYEQKHTGPVDLEKRLHLALQAWCLHKSDQGFQAYSEELDNGDAGLAAALLYVTVLAEENLSDQASVLLYLKNSEQDRHLLNAFLENDPDTVHALHSLSHLIGKAMQRDQQRPIYRERPLKTQGALPADLEGQYKGLPLASPLIAKNAQELLSREAKVALARADLLAGLGYSKLSIPYVEKAIKDRTKILFSPRRPRSLYGRILYEAGGLWYELYQMTHDRQYLEEAITAYERFLEKEKFTDFLNSVLASTSLELFWKFIFNNLGSLQAQAKQRLSELKSLREYGFKTKQAETKTPNTQAKLKIIKAISHDGSFTISARPVNKSGFYIDSSVNIEAATRSLTNPENIILNQTIGAIRSLMEHGEGRRAEDQHMLQNLLEKVVEKNTKFLAITSIRGPWDGIVAGVSLPSVNIIMLDQSLLQPDANPLIRLAAVMEELWISYHDPQSHFGYISLIRDQSGFTARLSAEAEEKNPEWRQSKGSEVSGHHAAGIVAGKDEAAPVLEHTPRFLELIQPVFSQSPVSFADLGSESDVAFLDKLKEVFQENNVEVMNFMVLTKLPGDTESETVEWPKADLNLVTINRIDSPDLLQAGVGLLKPDGRMLVTFAAGQENEPLEKSIGMIKSLNGQDAQYDYKYQVVRRPDDYPASNQNLALSMLVVAKHLKSDEHFGEPEKSAPDSEGQKPKTPDASSGTPEFNIPFSQPARPWLQTLRFLRIPGMVLLFALFRIFGYFARAGQNIISTPAGRARALAYLQAAIRTYAPLNHLESQHYGKHQITGDLLSKSSLLEGILGSYNTGKLAVDGDLALAAARATGYHEASRRASLAVIRTAVAKLLIRQIIYYRSAGHYHQNIGSRWADLLARVRDRRLPFMAQPFSKPSGVMSGLLFLPAGMHVPMDSDPVWFFVALTLISIVPLWLAFNGGMLAGNKIHRIYKMWKRNTPGKTNKRKSNWIHRRFRPLFSQAA